MLTRGPGRRLPTPTRSLLMQQRVNKTLYRSQWRRTTEYIGHRDGVLDISVPSWNASCFATASMGASITGPVSPRDPH